jgi:molybdopterin-guanine dinucleotide biosynthesis protein A
VTSYVERSWRDRPIGLALFVGGNAQPMCVRTSMIALGGRTPVEHVLAQLAPLAGPVLLVGGGPVPRAVRDTVPTLPDAPDAQGALAGLLGLLRHSPGYAWLVVGCDQHAFAPEHARFLMAARRPGAWAIVPRLGGRDGLEPFGAIIEPQLRAEIERAAARRQWALHELFMRVPMASPIPPAELEAGWR